MERGVLRGIITSRDMAVLLEKTYLLYRELYGAIAEFKERMMDFEKKFRSKIPAQWEADREAVVRQERAKILGLFRQGKSVEEVAALLAQEAEPSLPVSEYVRILQGYQDQRKAADLLQRAAEDLAKGIPLEAVKDRLNTGFTSITESRPSARNPSVTAACLICPNFDIIPCNEGEKLCVESAGESGLPLS